MTGEPRREPASVSQRVLHMMEHFRGSSGGLNNPVIYRVDGRCDVAAFTRALVALGERHEALRTTFTGRGQRLTGLVHDRLDPELTVVDLTLEADPVGTARGALAAAMSTSLDLRVAPIRYLVLQRADDHVVCANVHHLATDGWSNTLIERDLRALYQGEALPPIGWQYADFARYQRERLDGDAGAKHRAYWERQLDGAHSPELSGRVAGPAEPTEVTGAARFVIDADLADRVRELAAAERTTPFVVLLAVFEAYLHSRTGQTDVAVATLMANRTRREVADTVGCFSTMSVMRVRFAPAPTFRDLVRATRATVLQALVHQEYPLQLLPANIITTDAGRADDVVFQMLPAPVGQDALGPDVEDLLVEDRRRARFDVEMILAGYRDGRLAGTVRYAVDHFDQTWAEHFVTDYLHTVETVLSRSDAEITALGEPDAETEHHGNRGKPWTSACSTSPTTAPAPLVTATVF